MSLPNSPIEILKLLDKSNCKECGYPTCLAFASVVFKGQNQLDKCTRLNRDIIEKYGTEQIAQNPTESDPDESLEKLKAKLAGIDLCAAADRLGAKYESGKITMKVCGKDFSVDSGGNFYSEIHIHSWITGPLLNYIIQGAGKPLSGNWVSIRELKNGSNWHNFFRHKCEKPIKKVADRYPDLFEDMLHIFNGRKVKNHYQSDISLVLYPLPKVPILFCYWKPEEGLDSSLNIFFDSTATDNISIEFIYSLGTGLATMFEKIALRHGY